jgi:hypothetical protein
MAAPKAIPVIAPANADPVLQRVVGDINKTIVMLRAELARLDGALAQLDARVKALES